MDNQIENIFDAEAAYEKTNKVINAYSHGDLHGGNPMCHIENYAKQIATQFAMWILESGFTISNSNPHKWQRISEYGYDQFTENQMYEIFYKEYHG